MDNKKLIIKGNKKIPLYVKSGTFSEFIERYLSKNFVDNYQRKRPNKIQTIIDNVYQNFDVNSPNFTNDIKNFFLRNPKLKLPWSDDELKKAQKYCLSIFHLNDN